MRTKMKVILIAFIACYLVGLRSWTEETPRYALIIGNAAYSADAALKNPVNDAQDVAASLKQIGWKVALVTDTDRRGFNRAVAGFRDELAAHEGADALFFYAGHGMQVDGANYLIPVKTEFETLDDVKADAIDIRSVTDAIQQAKANVSLIILDACRDNPFAKKMSRSLGGTRGLTVVRTGGGLAGSAIMFSTSPGDVALDGNGRNGLFTGALLKYLNSDLKLEDVFKKVTGEVHGLSGGAQNPWINASLSSDFFFISESTRAARAAEAAKAAEAARQAEIAKAAALATAEASGKAKQAQAEAEAAKQAAAAALAMVQAERNSPKGKVRIESYSSGKVYLGKELLGEVEPGAPLISDSLSPGKQDFRFASDGSPDELKTATISDKAYVTVLFGKAPLGNAPSYPGSISVSVAPDGAVVSLDGQEDLPLPHIFEYLSPGEHRVLIRAMTEEKSIYSTLSSKQLSLYKVYLDLDEKVTVESGKQVKFRPDFHVAKTKIIIKNIPQGFTLQIDGEEKPLTAGANGKQAFEGEADAGDTLIEFGNNGLILEKNIFASATIENTYSFDTLRTVATIQRRSIKLKGKDEDFVGVVPIFPPAIAPREKAISGSQISGGSICRDEKNLYCRIDFSNGKPVWTPSGARLLVLRQGSHDYHLQTQMHGDQKMYTSVYDAQAMQQHDGIGTYAIGPSFIELSFPLSWFSKKLDFSKAINASLCYWTEKGIENNGTPDIGIIIGK
jgi:uncharacterized caspase-like protein